MNKFLIYLIGAVIGASVLAAGMLIGIRYRSQVSRTGEDRSAFPGSTEERFVNLERSIRKLSQNRGTLVSIDLSSNFLVFERPSSFDIGKTQRVRAVFDSAVPVSRVIGFVKDGVTYQYSTESPAKLSDLKAGMEVVIGIDVVVQREKETLKATAIRFNEYREE